MHLERLKEWKREKNVTTKQIAEGTNLPDKTISRIYSGKTPNPSIDTMRRIANYFDKSLDDLFAEAHFVIGSKDLETLQGELDAAKLDNAALQARVAELTTEIALLKERLEHKEEIIALHNHYNKLLSNN